MRRSQMMLMGLLVWTNSTLTLAQSPQTPLYSASSAGESTETPAPDPWATFATPRLFTYLGLDYLLWFMKPVCLKVPVLTTGSPNDPVPGALHQPGTQLLVGSSKYEFGGVSGIRPRAGMLLTSNGFLALEVEGFYTETGASHTGFATNAGSPPTYLVYQAPDNSQQAIPFSIPGVVNGSVFTTGTSQIWGAEANVVANILWSQWGDVQLQGSVLGGFRYLDLSDHVTIRNTQALVANPSVVAYGEDNFRTHNQFFGVQLGNRLTATGSRWACEGYGKIAFGETLLSSSFDGTPLATQPVLPGVIPGPIQVLPSNAIAQSTYRVTIVPEIGAKFRYALTDHWTLTLGYSLLYWNRILCPGDLMDTHVNTTQLPFRGPPNGALVPAIQGVHTDYFLHGVNAGLEWRF